MERMRSEFTKTTHSEKERDGRTDSSVVRL